MHADIAAYIAHLVVTQKSPLTVARYGAVLEELEDFGGDQRSSAVTRDQIRRFAAHPRKDGTSRTPAGVNVRIAIVKAFFRFMREERGLAANPTAGVVGVPEPRRTPKYLTVPEVHRLPIGDVSPMRTGTRAGSTHASAGITVVAQRRACRPTAAPVAAASNREKNWVLVLFSATAAVARPTQSV